MKHLIANPEATERFGGYCLIYSCEYDNGKRSMDEEPLRLGGDGKIMFFPCHSCAQQIREYGLFDAVAAGAREAFQGKSIKEFMDLLKDRPVVKIGNQDNDA